MLCANTVWIVSHKLASDRYFAQQNYGFIAQSIDCPLSILHKVWIKQSRLGLRQLYRHNFRHNRHAKALSIMPA